MSRKFRLSIKNNKIKNKNRSKYGNMRRKISNRRKSNKNSNSIKSSKLKRQRGGQLMSLHNNSRFKNSGLNNTIRPKHFNKTAKNSFVNFLVQPLRSKSLNNVNTSKYNSTLDCFNDLQHRFEKCYDTYKNDKIKKRECKSKIRNKLNECQQIPNKYTYSFSLNNKKHKSISELRNSCWQENVDKKAKCFSLFKSNSFGSAAGILVSNGPVRTCAKKYQKKIEFCQPSPQDTKKLFNSIISKQYLSVSKNKIPSINNNIINNLS